MDFLAQEFGGHQVTLWIGLADGHVFCRDDHGETVPKTDPLEHRLDLLPQGPRADAQRQAPPEGADELFHARKCAELPSTDQFHHRPALAGHEAQERLW